MGLQAIQNTVLSALSFPTECTLKVLFKEHELSEGRLLESCFELEKILSHYKLDIEPKIGLMGLDEPRILKRSGDITNPEVVIQNFIDNGEDQKTEFKATIGICTDTRKNKPEIPISECEKEALRKQASKEIAAMLNAEGGTILFGVTDDGLIYGCDEDFSIFKGGGSPADKADLIIKSLVEKYFEDWASVYLYLAVKCLNIDSRHVIMVQVANKQRLSFLKSNHFNNNILYLRLGTNAMPINFLNIESYFQLSKLN